jgi:hypothetical protein
LQTLSGLVFMSELLSVFGFEDLTSIN